jgi:glycosyltransferase involved in cell wall biosynthesis
MQSNRIGRLFITDNNKGFNNVNTIHICIQTYNGEKTLRRAIDSILSQTYKDYIIYVCDDASTDSTPEIMRDYEKRGFIKAYFNDTNGVYSESGNAFLDVKNHISNDDFYAQLDHDDELYPQFFEKLLNFALENDLDLAEGSFCVNTEGVVAVGGVQAQLVSSLILETPEDFDKYFGFLYNYSWQIWGKLYRGNVSGELKYTIHNFGNYGHDTTGVLNAAIKARRVGLFCEPLMVYYSSPSTASYKYDSRRLYWPAQLYSLMKTVLNEKAHRISQDNYLFICRNYVGLTLDCLSLYCKHNITIEELIKCIDYILKCDATAEIYSKIDYFKVVQTNTINLDLFSELIEIILVNFGAIDPDRIRDIYHIFYKLIYSPKNPKFSAADIDYLLDIDIRLANLLLKGDFENAALWLENLPKSITEFGISEKVKMLSSQNMT